MLTAGTRLGSYEVVAPLGAGGMGEVYRAVDTRLDRLIAIKVLPEPVRADPDRIARFEREAKLLASLNHPNIAGIHGLERVGDEQFIVMELVDGRTLADQIARGPIPVAEALQIARQIAEALEAAHEAGVIHRDLKPANVKARPDGTVKVLDFGLAKALSGDPLSSPASLANSPTITSPVGVTGVGVLLGTAAYMSPEQAKGRAVDRRSDVWAFGCVLFEMITGRRAFAGDDVGDTLAAVLRAEPDWSLLPKETDFPVRTLLRGCLEKDARLRIGSLSAVLFVLRHQTPGATKEIPVGHPVSGDMRRVGLLTTAALILGAAVAGTGVAWLTRSDPHPVVRTTIATSGGTAFVPNPVGAGIAITSDGSRVIYGGNNQLLVRPLDRLQATILSGLGAPHSGFFSPDGQWMGFFDGVANAPIQRVSITGGSPEQVCAAGEGVPSGATWGPDNTIIFATYGTSRGLQRVPAFGGEPIAITKVDQLRGEGAHLWPEFLPGGQAVLFTIMPPIPRGDAAQVAVLDLRTGTFKTLIRGGSHARYAPSGHLVYGVGGSLHAVRFDLKRLEVVGTGVQVVEGIATTGLGAVSIAIAQNGSLVYVAGASVSRDSQSVAAVDRSGRSTPLPGIPPNRYRTVRVSPDGTRLALSTYDNVSIYDLARETLLPLATGPTRDLGALWTPDGQRIIFTSTREGSARLFVRRADGTGGVERVFERASNLVDFSPDAWSKDGSLLFSEVLPKLQCAIGRVSLERPSDVTMLMQDEFCNTGASLSPNGRWIAYNRGQTMPPGIYVERYPELGDRQFIGSSSEDQPVWSRDGGELFFKSPDSRQLLAVAIQSGTTLVAGRPQVLFELPMIENAGGVRGFDLMADGRFVIVRSAQPDASLAVPPQINVVQNWTEELKRLVPTN